MTISIQSVAKRCATRQGVALPSNAMRSQTIGLKHGRKISPMRGDVMLGNALRSKASLCGAIQHSLARKGQKISFAIQRFAVRSAALQGRASHCAPASPLRKGRKIYGPVMHGLAVHGTAPLCSKVPCKPTASQEGAEVCAAEHRLAIRCIALLHNPIPSSEGTDFLSIASQAVPSSAQLCAACRCNASHSHSIPSKGGKDLHCGPMKRTAWPSGAKRGVPGRCSATRCFALQFTFPAHPGNGFYELN